MLNHDESAIQIMKNFVEGEMDIKVFKNEFDNNVIIKKTLQNDPLCPRNTYYLLPEDRDIIRLLEMQNWFKTKDQLTVWGEIKRFLLRYDYPFTPTMRYKDNFKFLLSIQPHWLDILENDFLNEQIISKIPDAQTKAKQIAWCKARLKELFRCDNNYPRWIQNPEWPILNGIPMVFKQQIKVKKDSERVDYVFYNPDTGKEHIITQWY